MVSGYAILTKTQHLDGIALATTICCGVSLLGAEHGRGVCVLRSGSYMASAGPAHGDDRRRLATIGEDWRATGRDNGEREEGGRRLSGRHDTGRAAGGAPPRRLVGGGGACAARALPAA